MAVTLEDARGAGTSRRPRVTVVGSFAVGLTLRTDRFPVPGETRIGGDFDQGPGGKGSNQAVQAARLGAETRFVGALGGDDFAEMGRRLWAAEGVEPRLKTVQVNTGVGFIILNAEGENFIVLDPGANHRLEPGDLDEIYPLIQDSDVVITQLEIPVETAVRALELARRAGVVGILNPAPAAPIPLDTLGLAHVVTPNETELRVLLGLPADDPTDSLSLCGRLLEAGVETVVLTRGSRGALIVTREETVEIPAFPVSVVDTTGAGDAFSGALAVALAEGRPLAEAARFAAAAGAMACTALGVIPALARREQVERLLQTNPEEA